MPLMYCRDCKIEVDTDVYKRCPQCNQAKNGLYYAEDSIPPVAPTDFSSDPTTSNPRFDGHEDAYFALLVMAQNRTTHAVRSLAMNFVAAPIVTFIVLVVVALAVRSGNLDLVFIAGAAGITALLMMLIKSLDELSKSKI